MMAGCLTTLRHVKDYLGVEESSTGDDALLTRMVKAASQSALQYMQRASLAVSEYTDQYDGYGNPWFLLRQYPVVSVKALSVLGRPLTEAEGDGFTSPFQNGYVVEPVSSTSSQQRVTLYGTHIPRGRAVIMVKYEAGYLTEKEAHVVPPSPFTVDTQFTWLENREVVLEDGSVLAEVSQNPGPLEYSVSEGVYKFNVAQQGVTVLISYSYVPADVEQAVIEMTAEVYKYKDRIGYTSKSLGGQETVSFDNRRINPFILALLNPYKRVIPT